MTIIKDMDMPENCFKCRFELRGWCTACEGNLPKVQSLDRPDWCPLKEIPEAEIIIEPDGFRIVDKTGILHIHHNPEDAHREDFGGGR